MQSIESDHQQSVEAAVVKVEIPIEVAIPKEYDEECHKSIASYVANYVLRGGKYFKKFDWGVGAFAFRPTLHQGQIVLEVMTLDSHLKFEHNSYSKEVFESKFGTHHFVEGEWPEKEDSMIQEKILNFDRYEAPRFVELKDEPGKGKEKEEEIETCSLGEGICDAQGCQKENTEMVCDPSLLTQDADGKVACPCCRK